MKIYLLALSSVVLVEALTSTKRLSTPQKPKGTKRRTPPPPSSNAMEMVDLGQERKRALIQVTGMSCSSCVTKIERHLAKKRGKPEGLCQSVTYDTHTHIHTHTHTHTHTNTRTPIHVHTHTHIHTYTHTHIHTYTHTHIHTYTQTHTHTHKHKHTHTHTHRGPLSASSPSGRKG